MLLLIYCIHRTRTARVPAAGWPLRGREDRVSAMCGWCMVRYRQGRGGAHTHIQIHVTSIRTVTPVHLHPYSLPSLTYCTTKCPLLALRVCWRLVRYRSRAFGTSSGVGSVCHSSMRLHSLQRPLASRLLHFLARACAIARASSLPHRVVVVGAVATGLAVVLPAHRFACIESAIAHKSCLWRIASPTI